MNYQKQQVKVFHIPFDYKGFTENLLKTSVEGIRGNEYSGILYIAPTPRKIRDSQKIFHKLVSSPYIPPEMMTIKQLSKKLYSLYGDKTIISISLIPILISRLSGKGIGFSSIISNFIAEIKQYRPDKDIEAIRSELQNIFKELNVPEEGSRRAMDAVEIFKEYQEVLDRYKTLDENDLLRECPELIEKHNYALDVLILDSFYEVTPVEELILKKLIEQSKTTFISIYYDDNFTEITDSFNDFIKKNFKVKENSPIPLFPYSGGFAEAKTKGGGRGFKDLSYCSYPGVEEEVEGIAKHIKNLFISGKYRSLDNIILTFPKLHLYSDIVQRVFRRYGIPCTFSISKPAGKIKPFLDLIAMLESIADDYPRLLFSQFLISPYFKELPDIFREWIPRVSLNSGIIKGKNSWFNLKKALDTQQSTVSNLPIEIEKKLKWVFKKLEPLESIKNTGTYKQFYEILHKLLTELNFSDPVRDPGRGLPFTGVDIKEQVIAILKDLSMIENILMGGVEGTSGLRHFIDSLRHILNTTEIETEGTGVQVSGFFELRGTEPEYLYLGGLKDGDLPSMPEIDLILPDSVRTRLGLINMRRYLYLQKFIFHQLMDSSKNLHLSYPEMEADKLFLPSPFLPWKTGTSEYIPGILCKGEELLRQGKTPLSAHVKEIDNIKNDLIKKQFREKSYVRVTDIDYYRTCPRKFFIERILNLEPSEIKEYEIEAMLLGTIIHRIMEKLISKPFENYDALKVNAEKLLEEVLDEQPIEDYWKSFIRDSFLSILPEIYEIESDLVDEGYSFMKAEVPVEGEVIKGIRLKGKIDRVDKKVTSSKLQVQSYKEENNEVQLIDYKTGATQFSRSEILNKGAGLQLFLYAALMKSLGHRVNRVGIYSLKDIKIVWIPGKTDKREGRTIEDYIRESLKYLEKTLSRMREGDFIAFPLNEQTCRNCHERPYCPYIQTSSF